MFPQPTSEQAKMALSSIPERGELSESPLAKKLNQNEFEYTSIARTTLTNPLALARSSGVLQSSFIIRAFAEVSMENPNKKR